LIKRPASDSSNRDRLPCLFAQQGTPSPKRERTLRLLQGIQQRLTAHVAAPQQPEETSIPLTAQEIHALEDAMGDFVQLVRQVIPPSNQRDDLLQQVEDLCKHLQMAFTSYQS